MTNNRLYESEYLEDKIKTIIDTNSYDDFMDVIKENNYFEYHYFLSHLRHDLLIWYPFKKETNLLEIGSGYGQLTSLFDKKVNRVVAIENTRSKCEIIKERCENTNVICSDFNNFDLNEKFDYIVLCNMFEYVKSFYNSENPYEDYLKYLKTLLKEDGVILIALSNRLGLKYFAGFREEHTNQFFKGIDNYKSIDYVETFSKSELIDIIQNSGFTNYKFFYPYPDHEFTQIINTDDLVNIIPYSRHTEFYNDRTVCFDEGGLNQSLAKDNLADYFSNSFLIELRNSSNNYETDNIKYVKINSERKEEYRTSTIIWKNDKVSKSPISPKANNHIKKMYEESKFDFGRVKYLKSTFNNQTLFYEFLKEKTLEDLMVDRITRKDKEGFFKLLKKYYNALFYNSFESNFYSTDDFLKVFKEKSDITFHCHEKSNLDLIFSNIFVIEEEFVAIDYEWIFDFQVPLEYLFYRVIYHHIFTNKLFKDFTTLDEIFTYFNLDVSNIPLFREWDKNFIRFVFGNPPYPKRKIISLNNLDNPEKVNEYFEFYLNPMNVTSDKRENFKKDIVLNQRKIINKKNKELKKKNKQLKKKNNELKKKNKEIKSLINSNSWKITRPLRKLKFLFR